MSNLLGTIECGQGIIRAVRFNVDGNYCLTCGGDKTIVLWNPYKNLKIKVYEGQGYESLDVDSSQDNSKFACCGMDKNVRCIDIATGKILRKFKGHAGRVNCVRFNEDSSILLSGSIDSTVRIWDLRSYNNNEIQILGDAKDSITRIRLSQYEIFTASADCRVRRYDLRTGKGESDYLGREVTSIDITNKGDTKADNYKCILAQTLNSALFLLDGRDGKLLTEYRGHLNNSFQLESCLSHDDNLVYSGSEDGFVYVWDLLEAKVKTKLKHTDFRVIPSLSPHPSKSHLLSSAGKCVYLWDTGTVVQVEEE